jgi:hypothetical protein
MDELLERLAELEHQQWVEWSQTLARVERLSEERLERWRRLWVPYCLLSEESRDQDREYALKVLKVVIEFLSSPGGKGGQG